MSEYIPLFQTIIWAILIFAAFLYLKSDLQRLRDGFAKRLDSGSQLKVGPIELGELKSEMKQIRSEVRETKKVVHDEVKTINDRFNQLTQKSRDFLQLKPLSETWDAINKAKESLATTPLSTEELDKSLTSLDPNERVPGYLQLQIHPQEERLETVLDALYLEMFLSRKSGFETRPMWQAIEALRCIYDIPLQLQQDRRNYARFVIDGVISFLNINVHLDKGGECKRDLKRLLDRTA